MTIRKTILAAALVGIVAAPVLAEELKFASFTPPQHTVTASVIDKLNADVSAATGGALTVRGYLGGELGAGPVEQYVRALQGVADITWGLPGYTSSQFERTMIAELPGAIPDGSPGYKGLWAAFDAGLKQEFPGTKVLALWTSEPNVMIMKDREIRSPADLAGLKIRVAGSTAADVATALGATPVQMPINQVYNAMQTGLIDGVFTGSSTLSDFKLNEVSQFVMTGAPLGRLTFFTVMNEAKYNALPADQKAALDAASGEGLSKSAEDAWLVTSGAAMASAREGGSTRIVDLTADEIAVFAEAVSKVTETYVANIGAQDVLTAMRGE